MKRLVVRLSETVSLEDAISKLRNGLSTPDGVQSSMATQAEQTIRDLSKQGVELAALGSSFSATRTLAGDVCEVTIVAAYGQKPSLLKRLFGR
jgi:hypothetical protein